MATEEPIVKKRGRPKKIKELLAKPVEEKKGGYIFGVGRRKKAVARVFVYQDGKSGIEVNGQDLPQYFKTVFLRNVVKESLEQSPFKNSLRIIVKASGGGMQGQAEAVRLGITRILLKLDSTLRPVMRAKGFLTRDSRRKERKKPGLRRARRAPQFSKR